MSDGRIDSFLRMTGFGDGTGDNGYSSNNFSSRRANVRNHYIKTGYQIHKGMNIDPDTGEILDYKAPKDAKNPYRMAKGLSLRSVSKSLPDPSVLINIGIVAGIGLIGYNLYKKFFGNNALEDIKQQSQLIVDHSYVDAQASKVTATNATTTALNQQGYGVSTLHINLANTLYDLLNTGGILDGSKIVATIKTMSDQTFQLVSSAYGTRNLNKFENSLAHVLYPSSWTELFSKDKKVGTLKDHLKFLLSDSEQSKISHYLNLIS